MNGGPGEDIVRGGIGNDALRGGSGIDQLIGDLGDDRLFGDSGSVQQGQRLFGGPGRDTLFAFAPTTDSANESLLVGDQLFGGEGGDFLYGNLRQETLIGGPGNDYLHGDYLNGPVYNTNSQADTTGGNDLLMGDNGEDQIFGGGGDDTMWGGPGTDYLVGQRGSDTQYGGSDIDLFVAPNLMSTNVGSDVIDGHFGNLVAGDTPDDNATDILVVNGSTAGDTILLAQTRAFAPGEAPALLIQYNSMQIEVHWRDALAPSPRFEQIQVAGLGGDDKIGFAQSNPLPGMSDFTLPVGTDELEIGLLAARSNDFVGVFDGNDGNDILVGAAGRDRLDGGRGSDELFGLGGDDRLWGDIGGGSSQDEDQLFAGGGNDDLVGGQGKNHLYAWSFDPTIDTTNPLGVADPEFGVFQNGTGALLTSSVSGNLAQEDTGLNRMLGNSLDDHLFGGTALDFLYGNGGNDLLYRRDGSLFESLDGGLAGDAWKEYAKDTGQVWYVSGSNANDEIHVDFVTEPGLLSDHHLITRLTDNNGNFSFSAQVRLDFSAVDGEGNSIWDPNDTVLDFEALRNAENDEQRGDGTRSKGIRDATTRRWIVARRR